MKQLLHFAKKISKNKLLRIIVTLLAIAVPLSFALLYVKHGHIIFWYDNARDLFTAWENLSKPTLIGPTSGIPGIFYGPYWIWLLSFGLLFSQDPIVVMFITAILPYFIIFPILWFRLAKQFGFTTAVTGWLLFMMGSGMIYATQIWNPYPAPLIFLACFYLLVRLDYNTISKKNIIKAGLLGFLVGLLINFHISFGIAFLLATFLFLVWITLNDFFPKKKNSLKVLKQKLPVLIGIGAGFLIVYIPTLFFEVRHGFLQMKTLLQTLTQFGDVVSKEGLTKPLILNEFLKSLGKAFLMPEMIALEIIAALLTLFLILLTLKKIKLNETDKKIAVLLLALFTSISLLYFTAKNPVWEYHFIGVDLLFVLVLMFLLSKIPFIRYGFLIWAIYAAYVTGIGHYEKIAERSYFALQKEVTQSIINDAKGKPYTVAAFTDATYNHEYTYLFRWLAGKDVPSDATLNPPSDLIYLIIPEDENQPKVKDFINYRSREEEYDTVDKWDYPNNEVIKRIKQKE